MDKKYLEFLRKQIEISKKTIKQLESQMNMFDRIMDGVIQNANGEDKQKLLHIKALSQLAIAKAKKGQDYNEVIEKMKSTINTSKDGS